MDKQLQAFIRRYYTENHKKQIFIPRVTPVKVAGRVFDHNEI